LNLLERVDRYISKVENALKSIEGQDYRLNLDCAKVAYVIDLARMYAEDAKYFRKKGDLETALAAISYSEGLLDALRLIGVVSFEWV